MRKLAGKLLVSSPYFRALFLPGDTFAFSLSTSKPRQALRSVVWFAMLLSLPLSLLCASAATASTLKSHPAGIQKRDDTVCTDLSVSSNNGDRKVAIVMDSSGSMAYNDYYDLRISAGRALNEFLISSAEASGSQKADLVTVIDFDDAAYLDYPLGDPGGANASFSKVDSSGGTYIASGVDLAIKELTGGGGATDKRSAIVIFTDGEDYYTDELVDAINNATAAGIRVSFGFLDTTAAFQPKEILTAVKNSRGVYATITVAAGSQNYINYVLLNGLTYNDNPQGYDTQLLAGLAETHFITGSDSVTLKYSAQQGENVNFTITTISAGELDVVATMGGQTLNSTKVSFSNEFIKVTAPSSGEMDLTIKAKAAPQDAMFSVITNSNVPFKNCTVGVTGAGQGGLSSGAKAGVGIGVTAALVGILGLGGYFLYKHFYTGGGGNGGISAPTGGEGGVQYAPGAEKPMAQANVYPIDPSNGGIPGQAAGNAPMSGPGQAPMSAPNLAPPGNGGIAPAAGSGGLPAANGLAPMAAPATGSMAPTGGAMYPGAQPFAFVPPLAPPPNQLNNKADKEKGNGRVESQDPQANYTMQNQTPGNFQQTMGPGGNQPMAPGSQGVVGPGSQAPMGYGPGNQPLSAGSQAPMGYGPPGSQVPLANGGESFGPGSQSPMGSGGQAPLSQYPSGPESFQQNANPNAYQNPMGQGNNPMAYDPNNGGLQQFGNQGNFQQPMGGSEGFQHTMGGQGQAPMGSNPGFHNGGVPGHQPPMSPDSFNHTMSSEGYQGQGSAPPISPNTTGGGDFYNQGTGNGGVYNQPTGGSDFTSPSTAGYDGHHPAPQGPGDWNNQPMGDGHNQSMHDANIHPMSSDANHPTDWNDYHDPDACSCSEGGSDGEGPTPGTATETNPGFTMPGAPFRSADKKHKHKRRRFPRLARSRVEKHHHHPWLGKDVECTDEQCPLNREHVCLTDAEGKKCGCKCRDEECVVYKRRLRERRHRDGGLIGVASAL